MQPEAPKKEKPVAEILRRIWAALTRKPLRKLAALALAVAFWAIVIASDPNLLIEKTIMNATVTVSGQDTLRSRGLTVIDDLSSGTITVKMRVQVKQSNYDLASADTFTPRLDLATQITQEGVQDVFFSVVPNNYGTVLSIEPASIQLEVEKYRTRSRVPVVVEPTGESGAPLYTANVLTDPSQITVSGPQSLVDKVTQAVVELPLGSLSASRPQDRLSSNLQLRDVDGKVLTSSMIRMTSESIPIDSATIDVSVYPVVDIAVDVDSAVVGTPAHGYTLGEVRITPQAVAVAAGDEVLKEMEKLYVTAPLDISSMTGSASATVPLRKMSGVQHVAVDEVTIEVDIQPAEHVHTYINLPVTVMGLDAGLNASLDHTEMDVILRGDYDKVQTLAKEDMTLIIDAKDLGAGVHTVPVRCVINGVDSFDAEPEYVRVTLALDPIAPDIE